MPNLGHAGNSHFFTDISQKLVLLNGRGNGEGLFGLPLHFPWHGRAISHTKRADREQQTTSTGPRVPNAAGWAMPIEHDNRMPSFYLNQSPVWNCFEADKKLDLVFEQFPLTLPKLIDPLIDVM